MKFLQGKPLHVRQRYAAIATGCIGIVLLITLVYIYSHPHPARHDPESAVANVYSTIVTKIQSLFHRK